MGKAPPPEKKSGVQVVFIIYSMVKNVKCKYKKDGEAREGIQKLYSEFLRNYRYKNGCSESLGNHSIIFDEKTETLQCFYFGNKIVEADFVNDVLYLGNARYDTRTTTAAINSWYSLLDNYFGFNKVEII